MLSIRAKDLLPNTFSTDSLFRPFFHYLYYIIRLEIFLKGILKMDKLCEDKIEKKKEGVLSKIKSSFANTAQVNVGDKGTLAKDLLLFSVGFLLSRCHLLFGIRPLSLAFLCAMPVGIWPTLSGAVIGSLSHGKDGIIFAVATAIAVFLRVAIGYSDKNGLFKEGLPIRMSIAVISGFVTAVFEVLRSGLAESSLLFGLSMVILPPLLTFIFSGLFTEKIIIEDLAFSGSDVFSLNDREKNEKYDIIFFQISALMLLFFVGLSFRGVDILGISASYIYSTCVTLLVAKRFGAIRGLAVGFASSLGLSGVLSVSFALAGLVAGGLFSLGAGYALLGGGVALCAFSAYSSGLAGLLGTLPEYVIGSALIFPLLKRINEIKKGKSEEKEENCSEDMVGTMALAYQNGYSGSMDRLEKALSGVSSVIKSYAKAPGTLTEEEYRGIVIGVAERHCIGCESSNLCAKEGIRPCIKGSERIAKELLVGNKIFAESINNDTEFCAMAGIIADSINREAVRAERENYLAAGNITSAEEYELISRLVCAAKENDFSETQVDSEMTPILTELMTSHNLVGTARAFGKRKKHFIIACEDEDGAKITSQKLRQDIEGCAGVKLDAPQYFRKDKMVLMECTAKRQLAISVATASRAGSGSEVSGDTVVHFETDGDFHYTLISDGMGSGEVAKETSMFVSDFLKSALPVGAEKEALIHMLNHSVKSRKEECSSTVDLLEIDLISGGGTFIKSGAAPSFVKRGSSIFRIRSQTAPIGLLGSIDTEKIKVDIRPGDYVIMLSDGVADEADDAPWLLLLLGEAPKRNLQEYANLILNEAIKNTAATDDMTVAVVKIDEA